MMKKILCTLFLFVAFQLCADDIPAFKGFVNDYAGVISDKNKNSIESVARELKEKTGAEVAILTVKSFSPYGSIEDFACRNFHPQNASTGRVWSGADGVSKSVI